LTKSQVLVFSKQMESYIKNRSGLCTCSRCSEPLVIGQQVMTRVCSRSRRKVYHLNCWEEMQI
jgi:hypothetical protein